MKKKSCLICEIISLSNVKTLIILYKLPCVRCCFHFKLFLEEKYMIGIHLLLSCIEIIIIEEKLTHGTSVKALF